MELDIVNNALAMAREAELDAENWSPNGNGPSAAAADAAAAAAASAESREEFLLFLSDTVAEWVQKWQAETEWYNAPVNTYIGSDADPATARASARRHP